MPSVAIDVRNGVDAAERRPIYMLHRVSGTNSLVSETKPAGSTPLF